MNEIQIYQAIVPGEPAPLYIFATDFQHASLLLAAEPTFQAGCQAGPVIMTNATGRLRQGPPDVARSTFNMTNSGFMGIATYDSVGGWQPFTEQIPD